MSSQLLQLELAPAPQLDSGDADDRDYSAPELTVVGTAGELTTENTVSAQGI
jgi:hypothetical protein